MVEFCGKTFVSGASVGRVGRYPNAVDDVASVLANAHGARQQAQCAAALKAGCYGSPFAQFLIGLFEGDDWLLVSALDSEVALHALVDEATATRIESDQALRMPFGLSRLRYLLATPDQHGDEASELYCELADHGAQTPWEPQVADLGRRVARLRNQGKLPRVFVNRAER